MAKEVRIYIKEVVKNSVVYWVYAYGCTWEHKLGQERVDRFPFRGDINSYKFNRMIISVEDLSKAKLIGSFDFLRK